ncbi:MAG: GAF domain-containing protein [Flavobacteriaceae bacterium]
MKNEDYLESPMLIKISFNKLLQQYDKLSESEDEFIVEKAKRILKIQESFPELRDGFSDFSLLNKYENEIKFILQDSFNDVLTNNEIKAASVPFQNTIFNLSERFKKIIKPAGENFELKIQNMPEDDTYIIACTIILKFCYGYNLNLRRPFFYEIPDEKGIIRYYKILYNADFVEIIPTEKAKKITQADVDELLDNYDDLSLWKEKFPPESYIFNGFVISNMFDVTDDQSISNIKSSLITEGKLYHEKPVALFHDIFRSFLNVKDLEVGFSLFDKEDNTFKRFYGGAGLNSYLLNKEDHKQCKESLCKWSYNQLVNEKKYFSISDIDIAYELSKGKAPQINSFKDQGIKSVVLAPIANDKELLGILELVSYKPKALNSINANKLTDVMPFILSAVERSKAERENLIEAVIQQECTSIHPSVHWKFKEEASNFIREHSKGNDVSFKKITFEDIYPLYGQIDIKGSSEARNKATIKDLQLQLKDAREILLDVLNINFLPIYEELIFQIDGFLENLETHFQVDSEQKIKDFFVNEITPLFYHLLQEKVLSTRIEAYLDSIDGKLNVVYKYLKEYDDTVSLINKRMSTLLDNKQIEAQKMYPHFFERFKTDGVEHNMYIGQSITKEDSFNKIYLYNLRLWQLQVMCEMENEYYKHQGELPINLDATSMILVFGSPLAISFRMDEKQFDVDGTYNARYEIVKKRVDKAYIKGTKERIAQKGKITIVYSQKNDELEYLKYIKFLQSKHYLDDDIEIVELQDLQAVTGLKAIRVSILYNKSENDKEFYTYNDLMKEIKS